jgi:succinyl-CoA synthetase beta subunit
MLTSSEGGVEVGDVDAKALKLLISVGEEVSPPILGI